MAQYDVDLRDYWRIVKKRKTIIILLVVLVGISSYGFAKLKEPKPLYQADSAIKIERSGGFYSMMTGWILVSNRKHGNPCVYSHQLSGSRHDGQGSRLDSREYD